MSLLFDQNLSRRLPALLATVQALLRTRAADIQAFLADPAAVRHNRVPAPASIKPSRASTVPTTNPPRTLDELARLGSDLFDRQVRPALRPEDDGKFVAIDVETGEYEIDADDYMAVARLRSRKPTADIWLMRAGSPTTCRIGGVR